MIVTRNNTSVTGGARCRQAIIVLRSFHDPTSSWYRTKTPHGLAKVTGNRQHPNGIQTPSNLSVGMGQKRRAGQIQIVPYHSANDLRREHMLAPTRRAGQVPTILLFGELIRQNQKLLDGPHFFAANRERMIGRSSDREGAAAALPVPLTARDWFAPAERAGFDVALFLIEFIRRPGIPWGSCYGQCRLSVRIPPGVSRRSAMNWSSFCSVASRTAWHKP